MSALNSPNSIKQAPFWIVGQIYSWNYSIHLNALTAELNLHPKVLFEKKILVISSVIFTKYRGIFEFLLSYLKILRSPW